jgi:transposase
MQYEVGAGRLVPDKLWALVEPLLPAPPRPPYRGRCRTIPDRSCFAGIVFMGCTSTRGGCCPPRELAALAGDLLGGG